MTSKRRLGGTDLLALLAARGINVADVRGYSVTPERDARGEVVAYDYAVTLRDGREERWREEKGL